MYEELSVRHVEKSQRPHRCEWCDDLIPMGTAMVRRTYKWDGDFNCAHMHPECYRALQHLDWKDYEDGFEPGQFSRGRTDDEKLPPQY